VVLLHHLLIKAQVVAAELVELVELVAVPQVEKVEQELI